MRAAAAALERGPSRDRAGARRSRSPRRRRAGSSIASGTRWPMLHSRLTARERYDEWTRLRSGRGAGLRGPALGGVRAGHRPRADRGRRGARRLLQAGGRSALRRPSRRRAASRRRRAPCCWWAARRRGRRASSAFAAFRCRSASTAGRCRRSRSWGWRGSRVPCTSAPAMPWTRCAATGSKAIVLLNRRGWSNFLTCGSAAGCGSAPRCDVTLVLHRAAGRMSCHHCGHGEPRAGRLPGLRLGLALAPRPRHRAARRRADHARWTRLPVFRLDADTVAGSGVGETLARFDAAPTGVLVGTQMVAKGHDFPDVTLGVVLDADATLRFPGLPGGGAHVRAGRSAGRPQRAGRPRRARDRAGSRSLRARPLRHAASHDAEGFLDGELQRRAAAGLPAARAPHPRGVLGPRARSGDGRGHRRARAHRLARLRRCSGPAPLFRLKGRERSQLVIKSRRARGSDRGGAAGRGGASRAIARTAT